MEYVDVMIDALTETVHVSFGKASTQQCRSGLGGVPALVWGGGVRVGCQEAHLGDRIQFLTRYRATTLLTIIFHQWFLQ